MNMRSRSLGRGHPRPAREVPLMATLLAFLKFVAKAVLNAIGGGGDGDFAVEVLPEVARDVWRRGPKEGSPKAVRAEAILADQLAALGHVPTLASGGCEP